MKVRYQTMGSPPPSYGRVNRDYEPQGFTGLGRFGPVTGGQTYHNSYNIVELAQLGILDVAFSPNDKSLCRQHWQSERDIFPFIRIHKLYRNT